MTTHPLPPGLAARFAHHPPTSADVIAAHEQTRTNCAELAGWIWHHVPASPERDQAIDAVDAACMYANAAIARHANYGSAGA